MGIGTQILMGSGLLFLCAGVQLWIIARVAPALLSAIARIEDKTGPLRLFGLICIAFGAMVLAHTLQIWLWAASFRYLGAFETLPEALSLPAASSPASSVEQVTAKSPGSDAVQAGNSTARVAPAARSVTVTACS